MSGGPSQQQPTGNTPYPGKMLTYPDQTKNAGPAWVHDCVEGCPGMPKRPSLMPGADGKPKPAGPPIGLQPQFPGTKSTMFLLINFFK